MPNDANLIESSEFLLDQYIANTHKKGLDYWSILKIMLQRCVDLMIQSQAEYYLKGGQ